MAEFCPSDSNVNVVSISRRSYDESLLIVENGMKTEIIHHEINLEGRSKVSDVWDSVGGRNA